MFGLDPESIANRVKASRVTPHVPTLRESVLRGAVGFTLVSLGGFAPWVLAGRWFYRNVGEAGLYAACAMVFVGLSGWLLHRLIIGPFAVVRFYKLFGLAFVAYAVLWTAGWMALGGTAGGLVGLLAGTAAMGAVLACGFAAKETAPKIMAVLFVTNAAGYFLGEWAYNTIGSFQNDQLLGIALDRGTRGMLAKGAWGLFYGAGFGGGIGFAFHGCQAKVRKILSGQH